MTEETGEPRGLIPDREVLTPLIDEPAVDTEEGVVPTADDPADDEDDGSVPDSDHLPDDIPDGDIGAFEPEEK